MQRLILSVILSFLAAIAIGPVVIPWLKRMKFGQTIFELGPETHKKKQGIPTMGGIIFVVPMLLVPVLLSHGYARGNFLWVALIGTLGFGAIGFVDDFIKVKRKRSLGLTPIQKVIPQLALSAALSVWAYNEPTISSKLIVPFTGLTWDLGWFFIPFMVFVLVGTVNSANLLDGLDGLLAGCSLIDFITMAMIVMLLARGENPEQDGSLTSLMLFCGAATGALMGFLRFNVYPAGVFMGDVGSFAIGGALAAVCLTTRLSLLLPIIALSMVVSSLSDIIQIGYFKLTHGKRVFRMAPLHHHFELSGMPETRIVSMYMIVTALLCLVALLGFTA
ncbi:phospho-N-acetylmuramoyl-pentapeptide-transferase [Bacillota bacterium Meth-B3]|nr:phospho-N-acetylmuramoyl-pentapeptide-transferase [Christensenellaceae bacterium]MEA5069087.1 phospho-N-acetylmuramoyl-pentapeptide-transferase [Christensenellaceae bacterium]